MPFTETLEALGSWELELAAETPDETIAQLGYFGHLVVVDGKVDVEATGNGLLAGARYVGVCRAKAKPDTYTRSGSGLLYWLGDEDDKGWTIETEISLTNATLAQVVTALLPPTVTVGTVFAQADPLARHTGKHVFQSRRKALAIALAPFGAELRVNPNFTVDVGTPAQLYDTALPLTSKPSPMIVRRGAGSDVDLVAVGGKVETEGAVYDYTTKATLLGQTIGVGDEPDTVFAVGSASAPSVPYKDPQGNAVKSVRLISESGETTGSVAARAQLQLNRFNRATSAVKVTADDYEISGGFGVGDATFVYDPDSGIFDNALQVLFRGQPIHPAIVRVSSLTTPIVEGMTVAWRTDQGVWLDLTRWVVWESAGSREITVGDLPKTLTKPSDPIQDRVDAARGNPSTKVPKTPTGLALTTASALNATGADSAVISASWNPVTQYVDNTTVALHHYEVQFRPQFRAPSWTASALFGGTSGDLPVTAALAYDVQVRAVSTGGVASAWSATVSITSAADSTAPPAPADPVLTQSLGRIRVRYPGTTNIGGAMPSDTNRVDVEVASAGSGGPFVVESSLNPFVEGIHSVGGTPLATRWVRLRAFDHNGNPSAYSGTVSAVIPQVQDGELAGMNVGKLLAGIVTADIVNAGRFTTALTGARREMNAVGFQAFDASGNLLINLDGVNNLLTGRFKTALSGRRIEMGAAGVLGQIDFWAPDATQTFLRSFSSTLGSEAIQIAAAGTGGDPPLSTAIFSSQENSFLIGKRVSVMIGGYTTGTRDFRVEYAPSKADMNAGRLDLFIVTPDETWASFTNLGGWSVRERRPGSYLTRMHIDGAGYIQFFFDIGAAGFVVNENVAGVAYSRMLLGGDRNNYFTVLGGKIQAFYTRRNDGTTWAKFYMDDGGFTFYYENLARVAISTQYGADASPGLSLIHDTNYGTLMAHVSTTTGTSHRLEFHDAGNTIYENLWAAAFVVSSSETGKGNMKKLKAGARDTLRSIEVVEFQRRAGRKTRDRPGREDEVSPRAVRVADLDEPELSDRVEIGVAAERAPAAITITGDDHTPMVDIGTTLFLGIAAQQETDAIVDDLVARVAVLEERGKP